MPPFIISLKGYPLIKYFTWLNKYTPLSDKCQGLFLKKHYFVIFAKKIFLENPFLVYFRNAIYAVYTKVLWSLLQTRIAVGNIKKRNSNKPKNNFIKLSPTMVGFTMRRKCYGKIINDERIDVISSISYIIMTLLKFFKSCRSSLIPLRYAPFHQAASDRLSRNAKDMPLFLAYGLTIFS